MSLVKTEAIVLRAISYHETSSIVRIFAEKSGVVSVIAKGARRLKSPFRGYLEPFNHVEVIYYYKATREVQTLANVELLRAYFADFPDVDKLLLPYSILEYLEKFTVPGAESGEIFKLVTTTFKLMEERPEMMELYFAQFLLDFSSIHGYRVGITNCGNCGKQIRRAYYDLKDGKFYCDECSYLVEKSFIFLDSKVLRALDYLARGEVEGIPKFCNEKDVIRLIEFLMRWIAFHFGVKMELKSFKVFSMIKRA